MQASPPSPARFTYRLGALARFPQRLFCPPDAGVGRVRSCRITPKYDVRLDDVLNARHLPPLGLKEFEEYLLWIERAPENLYFIFWLKKYEVACAGPAPRSSRVRAELHTGRTKTRRAELAASWACARATFFDARSPFELNLPADLVAALPADPPSPADLASVRRAVLDMLQTSLTNFVACSARNAGRARGIFAIVLGLAVMLVGLAPVLAAREYGRRWLAAAALPCFWIGMAALLAGLNGVCVVIFLFGDARQLYPFELRRPGENSAWELARTHSRSGEEISDAELAIKSATSSGGSTVCPFALTDGPSPSAAITPYLGAPAELAVRPAQSRSPTKTERALFAPMESVLSPLVCRMQWLVVMRAFAAALAFALVLSAVIIIVIPGGGS